MDTLPPEKRSWLMGLVRATDTNPEMVVRRLVYALGFRYRLHGKNLPGRPDIVFASRRSVIFVNGCFWHQHLVKAPLHISVPERGHRDIDEAFEDVAQERLKEARHDSAQDDDRTQYARLCPSTGGRMRTQSCDEGH